jgi:hypothetical protein
MSERVNMEEAEDGWDWVEDESRNNTSELDAKAELETWVETPAMSNATDGGVAALNTQRRVSFDDDPKDESHPSATITGDDNTPTHPPGVDSTNAGQAQDAFNTQSSFPNETTDHSDSDDIIPPIDSDDWDGVLMDEQDEDVDEEETIGGVSSIYVLHDDNPMDISHLSAHTTPNTPSPSRYRGLTVATTPSDSQTSFPVTLHKLETQTLRRQQDLHNHLHQIYCDIARLTAHLGQCTMERHVMTKECQQWWHEKMMHHTTLDSFAENTSSREESPDLSEFLRLLSRMDSLETRLTDSLHRRLDRQRRKLFDDTLEQETRQCAQDIALEIRKSDKRQNGVHRRWETMVGSLWARRWHEERASRYAAVEMMKVEIDNLRTLEQERGHEILLHIQTLRHQLAEERAERQRSDDKILRGIRQNAAVMQEALLEVFGDP